MKNHSQSLTLNVINFIWDEHMKTEGLIDNKNVWYCWVLFYYLLMFISNELFKWWIDETTLQQGVWSCSVG